MRTIAIIGGGFSGTMVLVQLVRQATHPLRIALIDSTGQFGRGVAYSTVRDEHLLNVPAGKMGASPDKIEGFFHWLSQKNYSYDASAYVPRKHYGEYMQDVLAQAMHQAGDVGHEIRLLKSTVREAQYTSDKQQFSLTLEAETRTCDAVVLACGNSGKQQFPEAIQAWRWFAGGYDASVTAQLLAAPEIHIIGTGLTMVDAALSLDQLGYKGTIYATSRHGWLPAAHQSHAAVAPLTAYPETASALYATIRHAAKESADWRAVMDAIRPQTQSLWRGLSAQEQKRIFRYAFSVWNVHRHRMAPEVAAGIERLRRDGQLIIKRGHVRKASGAVIDCTGPSYAITRTTSSLLASLLAQQLIEPHASGWGIAAHPNLRVRNTYNAPLFALGSLVIGEWFECTAVPELRNQAVQVADALLHV